MGVTKATLAVKLIAVAEKLALMRSHFLAPAQIASLFPHEARVKVETEEYTAWVIAEKEDIKADFFIGR